MPSSDMWHCAVWEKFNIILEKSAAFIFIVEYCAMLVNLYQLEGWTLLWCDAVSLGWVVPDASKDESATFLQNVCHYSSVIAM